MGDVEVLENLYVYCWLVVVVDVGVRVVVVDVVVVDFVYFQLVFVFNHRFPCLGQRIALIQRITAVLIAQVLHRLGIGISFIR